MVNSHLKKWANKVFVIFSLVIANISCAFASDTGSLPFESTMQKIEQGISGPFLMAASVIMVVITCLMLAFGEWGDGFKKLINIVLWLSIAFAATTFITTMFGGGAVF